MSDNATSEATTGTESRICLATGVYRSNGWTYVTEEKIKESHASLRKRAEEERKRAEDERETKRGLAFPGRVADEGMYYKTMGMDEMRAKEHEYQEREVKNWKSGNIR